jgi:hypothetical protein
LPDPGWGEPRTARLSASPLDVVMSDDGATAVVLGQDSVLRAVSAEAGREDRRLPLPGQPRRLQRLGARFVAALGGAGKLPLIDLTTWSIAELDVGGAPSDIVALGEGRVLIAASAGAARVVRFVAQPEPRAEGQWRRAGEIRLPRAPLRLGVTTGERELLAILEQGPSATEPGANELLDPRVEPFGVSRLGFPIALGEGAELLEGPGATGGRAVRDDVALVDRGGAELVRVTPSALEITPFGAAPRGGVAGAFRLLGRYVVVLDAGGAAVVVAEADGAAVATLELGAPPGGAAVTPDGGALLVALGGGAEGRGAETVVVSGDPPAITARLRTGAGSRAVSVAASGRRAAVASLLTRTLAILDRR